MNDTRTSRAPIIWRRSSRTSRHLAAVVVALTVAVGVLNATPVVSHADSAPANPSDRKTPATGFQ